MTSVSDKILRRVAQFTAPALSLPFYELLLPRNLVGFFYHIVSDEHVPHVAHLYPYKSAVAFEQDILAIKRHYTLVSYQDILAHHNGERKLPPKAAFLSFDDGFKECFTVVCPILLRQSAPCIFFLTTDAVDNQTLVYNNKASVCVEVIRGLSNEESQELLPRAAAIRGEETQSVEEVCSWLLNLDAASEGMIDRIGELLNLDFAAYLQNHQPYMTVEQVKIMKSEGFAFGGHTRRHVKLMHLDQENQAEEIIESCQRVAEWGGEKQVPFAFPISGAYVNREFLNRLREENPNIGLIFDINWLRKDKAHFIYNRIWMDQPLESVPEGENVRLALH